MRTTCWLVIGLLLAAVSGSAELHAETWTSLFGPVAETVRAEDLPLEWSPDKNIAWKAALPGHGQSSPVVWKGSVLVTSISGPMKEHAHVCALDVETGQPLWQKDFAAPMQVENTNYVSKAAPSPVVDAAGVIVLFESGFIVALDHAGQVRWEKNLIQDYGAITSRHGLGSSLAQNEQLVFVWIERQENPYLLALEKATGNVAWKADGLGAASWSTPALLTVGGAPQLVLSGSGTLAGYEVTSGARLWTLTGLSGNSIPTPQPLGDGSFLLGATVGRGEESAGRAADSNGVIRVSKEANGQFKAEFLWRSTGATSSFGSPIVHRQLAYFVNANGVLFCLDAQSGNEIYSDRLGDSIWATPLAIGDRIYFVGKSGTTTVVQAGAEFKKLAENRLWKESEAAEQVQYAVAAIAGRLLIRTGDALYCVGEGGEASAE